MRIWSDFIYNIPNNLLLFESLNHSLSISISCNLKVHHMEIRNRNRITDTLLPWTMHYVASICINGHPAFHHRSPIIISFISAHPPHRYRTMQESTAAHVYWPNTSNAVFSDMMITAGQYRYRHSIVINLCRCQIIWMKCNSFGRRWASQRKKARIAISSRSGVPCTVNKWLWRPGQFASVLSIIGELKQVSTSFSLYNNI